MGARRLLAGLRPRDPHSCGRPRCNDEFVLGVCGAVSVSRWIVNISAQLCALVDTSSRHEIVFSAGGGPSIGFGGRVGALALISNAPHIDALNGWSGCAGASATTAAISTCAFSWRHDWYVLGALGLTRYGNPANFSANLGTFHTWQAWGWVKKPARYVLNRLCDCDTESYRSVKSYIPGIAWKALD